MDLTPLEQLPIPLLQWYHETARSLPWRAAPTPYHVLVSELMLQQTRVAAVLEYYRLFMEALPTVEALAAVEDDRLMKLWQGLGYYNRARNLKNAARRIVDELGGEFPRRYEDILLLPGVGEYTAGAVASIAFGLPVPAVDGNVLRVVSRLTADYGDISKASTKRRMRDALQAVIPVAAPGDFNQALMDLGALVCLPNGAPVCQRCPAGEFCAAKRLDCAGELPIKPQKKARRIEARTVYFIFYEGKVALRRRGDRGLLARLWEYPNELSPGACPVPPASVEHGGAGKHIFTHVEWHMTGQIIRPVSGTLPDGWVWADREALGQRYAIPNAFRGFTPLVERNL